MNSSFTFGVVVTRGRCAAPADGLYLAGLFFAVVLEGLLTSSPTQTADSERVAAATLGFAGAVGHAVTTATGSASVAKHAVESATGGRKGRDRCCSISSGAFGYLVAHPTCEASQPQVSGPPLAITAVAALALHTQLKTARTWVNEWMRTSALWTAPRIWISRSKNLTAGTTISVYVIAANEGGEAAASSTVTKVVGS